MQTEKSGRPQAMIAMSGGVDSSVAAYLMQQAGYDCMGVTMKLYENEDAGVPRGHTCCALDDVEDARRVAYALGMPYYVFNYKDAFREQVMARFAAAYQRGVTPNPCLDCNRYLKFGLLETRARALGCEVLATGHYARIEQLPDGRYTLKKAVDTTKDQSYVLAWLTQEQLAHTRFPLGGLHKTEAREIAEAHGFCNAHKHDSQDICFVPDGDYVGFMEQYTGKRYPSGDFIDESGKKIGTHAGAVRYTIGQRRGLGLPMGDRVYVCAKDMEKNTVTVGPVESLFAKRVIVRDMNWISVPELTGEMRVKAKLRYRQKEQPAVASPLDGGRILLTFDEPQRGPAIGQAAVLYDGDTVVGGGTICGVPKDEEVCR